MIIFEIHEQQAVVVIVVVLEVVVPDCVRNLEVYVNATKESKIIQNKIIPEQEKAKKRKENESYLFGVVRIIKKALSNKLN